MESVVATVSGYHDPERFNLIKMISHSGASYVGNMNQGITHLVCWKFKGKKYELAKKLKTIVVNHGWIEECIKKGRRVPERPYTDQCGEEVGPLRFSPISHKPSSKSNISNGLTKQVIDLEAENDASDHWTDSTLLNENLLAEQSGNRHQAKKKRSTSNSTRDQLFGRRYQFEDLPLFGFNRMEDEQNLPDSEVVPTPKKRSSASGEPARRGRRLVKGKASRDTLESSRDPERKCDQAQISEKHDAGIATTSPGSRRHESLMGSNHATTVLGGIEEIEDANNVLGHNDHTLSPNGSLSCIKNLQECCSPIDANINTEHINKPSNPTEVSCAICWTEFSSTRGVLECGHRFCFSCIESWSYHLGSARKDSTCPLCKAKFEKITRVDDAVPSDQKVYSQTIPPYHLGKDVYILPSEMPAFSGNPSTASVCCQCLCQEPQELLEKCHLCQIRSIHIYCLDPPLFPWTCNNCKDLQMLYRYSR